MRDTYVIHVELKKPVSKEYILNNFISIKFKNRQRSMATNTRMALEWVAESLLRHGLFCILIWIVVNRCLLKWVKEPVPWEMLRLSLVLETLSDVFKKR